MLTALHFCAKNDLNGNPRRVYVIIHSDGSFVDAVDEGYLGINALYNKYPKMRGVVFPSRVDISPSEYIWFLSFARDNAYEENSEGV